MPQVGYPAVEGDPLTIDRAESTSASDFHGLTLGRVGCCVVGGLVGVRLKFYEENYVN